jgi:hypothetical protein
MQMLDIQLGMQVYGTDEAELGSVTEVWPYTETHGYISRKNHEIASFGPVGGTGDLMTSDRGYFEVTVGQALGLADTILYVPFCDVQDIVPGERVTVNCTEDACGQRYKTRPDVLDQAV